MSAWSDLSIKYRLIISVMLVMVLLMGAFVYDFYSRQNRFLINENRRGAINATMTMAASVSLLMQHNDVAGLSDIVNSYKFDKIVTRAIVTDNFGKVLADTLEGETGKLLSDEKSKNYFDSDKAYEIIRENAGELVIERPIVLNDAVIGRVWMTFDKTYMQKELNEILFNGIVLAVFAIFLCTLILTILAYSLTRKLAKLLEVARRITNGSRDARAKDGSTDEIGQLAQSFNNMLDALIHKENELEKLNAELEYRVEVRTREVTMAKNEAARISGELHSTTEKITHLVFHDSLTGLYNRTFFETEIRRLDACGRLPLVLIIGDVNNMRLTNEAFGFKIGDQLLKSGAQIMKDACRAEDIVVRYGDDTFLLLLPNCDETATQKICENIRTAASKIAVEHIPLSISLGVATKTEIEEDIFLTLINAEQRVLSDKKALSSQVAADVIRGMKQALAERKPRTKEHVDRVHAICEQFSVYLEFSDKERETLASIAELHDVGKIAVADEVLDKTGELTAVEWEMLKRHSEIGYKIASLAYGAESEVALAIRAHHEAWDGQGYPQKLSGEAIPRFARLLAVVDAFDAMTNDRAYYSAISVDEAIKELKFCSDKQFDRLFVEKFAEFMNKKSN